jgi:hypothetical protein
VEPVGELRLWSRRAPVCAIGVASGIPASALGYDYSCCGDARLVPGVSEAALVVPQDASRSWAFALNPGIIGRIDCSHATAQFVDAHVVVTPDGRGPPSCHVRYLDSIAALRRILRRW